MNNIEIITPLEGVELKDIHLSDTDGPCFLYKDDEEIPSIFSGILIDEKTKLEMEFYRNILNSPEAKNYHPSYIAALKLNASGFCHVCYDGPIWKEDGYRLFAGIKIGMKERRNKQKKE